MDDLVRLLRCSLQVLYRSNNTPARSGVLHVALLEHGIDAHGDLSQRVLAAQVVLSDDRLYLPGQQ